MKGGSGYFQNLACCCWFFQCYQLSLFCCKNLHNVFVASFLVKFGQNREIKSRVGGRCWSRHAWQHQPSDAAQSCLNRCILWGSGLFAKQVGVSKKSILTVHSLSSFLFSSLLSSTGDMHYWSPSYSLTYINTYTQSVSLRDRGQRALQQLLATVPRYSLLHCGSRGALHLLRPIGDTLSEGLRRLCSLQPVEQD